MKILIDIGHPAHVHYFRNFIKIMKNKGYKFLILARDKEVSHQLLNAYRINYITRGKGNDGIFGKLIYLVKINVFVMKQALGFKPDIFLSFSSPYAAQVSWVLRKPHIAFTDTEHAKLGNIAFVPFSTIVCTPSCYKDKIGTKHIKFNSYMELLYLSSKYFKPDINIYKLLGLNYGEKYAILRFVSWKANHDIGHKGITKENKVNAFNKFSKYAKVFISSEGPLPKILEKYRINIKPEKMHDAIAYASLLYGESSTMASESAVLGTPAIFLDNDGRGYTDEEEKKYGLIYNYTESKVDQLKSIEKGVELLSKKNVKTEWAEKRDRMLAEKIDATDYMVWLIENFPQSVCKVKKDRGMSSIFSNKLFT